MTNRARQAIADARRILHAELSAPALYIPTTGAVPIPCTVRVVDHPLALGKITGSAFAGAAQAQDNSPRIIFTVDDALPPIRNKSVVSIAPGVAYRIETTEPRHGITMTAHATVMPAADAVGLPVPLFDSPPSFGGVQTYSMVGGYGSIDYADNSTSSLVLPAGVRTRIIRIAAPSTFNSNLPRTPFAGFVFWDGSLLHARALGDAYLFKFAYKVTPAIRGAVLHIEVYPDNLPAFSFGPGGIALSDDAGVQESGSVDFSHQVGAHFVSGGGTVYAALSGGGTLDSFAPEITPLSFAP